jgi:hypothetical protein
MLVTIALGSEWLSLVRPDGGVGWYRTPLGCRLAAEEWDAVGHRNGLGREVDQAVPPVGSDEVQNIGLVWGLDPSD